MDLYEGQIRVWISNGPTDPIEDGMFVVERIRDYHQPEYRRVFVLKMDGSRDWWYMYYIVAHSKPVK